MSIRRPPVSRAATAAVSVPASVAASVSAAALVAIMGLACPAGARAEARLLEDREMREVWGRADVSMPVIPGLPSAGGGGGNGSSSDPGTQLTNALLKGATATMLDEPAFLATWKAHAGTDARPPTYDGRNVLQLELNAEPVTLSFELMSLLGAVAGGGAVHGPSDGMITLQNVDARGTTLWVWGH
jgi:hypothetical protein